MRSLLIRLYPARWRARYGDEFAAILEERPLGPFDVADILLGAFDAQLRLRGRDAAIKQGGFHDVSSSRRRGRHPGRRALLGGVHRQLDRTVDVRGSAWRSSSPGSLHSSSP